MRNLITSSAFILGILTMSASAAWAAPHAEVGSLACDVSAGLGVIVGTQQEMNCVFTPSAAGAIEEYSGKITEFGLDIGEISKAKMTWLVFAPATREEDALAGTYSGIAADAAVGVGLGAKVLVGGNHGTVTLQPISVQAEEGFNIAAGITALNLRPTK